MSSELRNDEKGVVGCFSRLLGAIRDYSGASVEGAMVAAAVLTLAVVVDKGIDGIRDDMPMAGRGN